MHKKGKTTDEQELRAYLDEMEDDIMIYDTVLQTGNKALDTVLMEKELPLTTKKNKNDHGYGMKSIRYTAEKYDGIVTVQEKNHIFMLQILIPVK